MDWGGISESIEEEDALAGENLESRSLRIPLTNHFCDFDHATVRKEHDRSGLYIEFLYVNS